MSELGLSFAFVLFVFLIPVLFVGGLFLLLMLLAVLGGPVLRVGVSPPQRIKLTGLLVYDRAPLRGIRIGQAGGSRFPVADRPVRTE
jgi:hypothetical protein